MKLFELMFVVVAVIKACCMAELLNETVAENVLTATTTFQQDNANDDDVEGRQLQEIQLYTNDERCNNIGVCSDMNYADKNVVVTFAYRQEIFITSATTYEVEKPTDYFTLTFINSKFANFPLQLFYAFKVQEVDFRNCSVETLKWDNFLSADKLSILLLSENLLTEIQPSLFALAENLSFLFLDSNRLSVLHTDSFKGLQKLNFLDLHNNRLEILPAGLFSYMPALQQINLSENQIKIIEEQTFSHNSRLFSIHLQQNNLTEIQDYAFKNQYHLKHLDISFNTQLKALVVANVRLENLWAKNCNLSRVNIYGEAVHVDLQQNSIKELYFSQPEYLETLRLKANALEQISSLTLTTNLRILDLSHNAGLKTLPDLFEVNALERLDVSNTSLKQIPLSVLTSSNKLRSLNVSYNQIEEFNPQNFKYLVRLTQFYIHHNNWNCYNLQMLMDMVIKPLQISYTVDAFEENFPGEYIKGIKCMYRIESTNDEEYYVDMPAPPKGLDHQTSAYKQETNFENLQAVEELRKEFKAINGINEQKFSLLWNKLNDIDARLKAFERFNQTMWKQISIMV